MKHFVFAVIALILVSGCATTPHSGFSLCDSDDDAGLNSDQKLNTYEALAHSYRLSGPDILAERYDKAARKLQWQDAADDVNDDLVDSILNILLFGGQSCGD